MENKITIPLHGKQYECIKTHVSPRKILTNQDFLFREVVESIKQGIQKGDKIPPVIAARIEDCLDFIPKDELKELSVDGQIILYDGNHRVKAYDELGLQTNIALMGKNDIENIPIYTGCYDLRDIRDILVSEGEGELERRMNAKHFYRRAG